MGRQIALNNTRLRPGTRWAHTEYSLEHHRDYLAARTGKGADDPDLMRTAWNRFGVDLICRKLSSRVSSR